VVQLHLQVMIFRSVSSPSGWIEANNRQCQRCKLKKVKLAYRFWNLPGLILLRFDATEENQYVASASHLASSAIILHDGLDQDATGKFNDNLCLNMAEIDPGGLKECFKKYFNVSIDLRVLSLRTRRHRFLHSEHN